jgi:hypothetical protein
MTAHSWQADGQLLKLTGSRRHSLAGRVYRPLAAGLVLRLDGRSSDQTCRAAGLNCSRSRFTKAFRSPVRPYGFSTKDLLYDMKGDLLEMRLRFLLDAAGLDHWRNSTSFGVLRVNVVWDVDFFA